MEISIRDICKAIHVDAPCDGVVTGVSTDTRTIKPGDLFIALKGESFDGNLFIRDALNAGAAFCICSDAALAGNKTVVTGNTVQALQDVAGFYRSTFDIPLAAVTGSSGKTTARCMITEVFKQKYNTLATQSNHNNEIGAAKTLLGLKPEHTAAVIEMGMNNFGELERISLCAMPTMAVITNIGTAHIENLKSREGILKAKLEVTAGMKQGATLIVNGDDDMLAPLVSDKYNVVRFGIDNAECEHTATAISLGSDGSRFTYKSKSAGKRAECYVPGAGMHNVYNALSAIAAGEIAGIEPEQAAYGLKSFVNEGQRQQIVRRGAVTVIEDCYNANPDSVRAALNTLTLVADGRRIAVLGDMLELGDYAAVAHEQVGCMVAANAVDVLLTLGELAKGIGSAAKSHAWCSVEEFDDKAALTQRLTQLIQPGDTVLFKASRRMRFEEIIQQLYKTVLSEGEKE